jgi:hypothetical protein
MFGLSLLLAGSLIAQPVGQPVSITLGHSVAVLTGPWRFHTGDNAAWADPRFDDGSWETVDLTPSSPDAHDGDVGLVGWVNGWGARGHAGYTGFAWYRLRVSVAAGAGDTLALLGPLQVDDAYQLYIDGHIAGETGHFTDSPPTTYNTKPRVYALPRGSDAHVIAIRVWTRPRTLLGDPAGGGIRIAPALGLAADITGRYDRQWLEKFNGYIVDCVEGLAFIPIAIMVLVLMRFDTTGRGYWWLIAALLLIGARRENQAIFFWLPYESRPMFDIVTGVLCIPLMTGAWLMAWRAWFDVQRPLWLPPAIGVLTLLLMLAQYTHAATLAEIARLACVAVLLFITVAGVRQRGREGWLAVPVVLLIALALFPTEVTLLHVPGIWFPFGVGVSRTEYAIGVFLLAMPALFAHRLLAFAPRRVRLVA